MKINIIALLTLPIFICLNAPVIDAAPYYERKIIKIVVGYNPGGGYDRMARLVAKHLPKHIPGKPTIIIENMEGAASIIGTNYLYNRAKPDGLTLGTFNRALPFAQLTKQEGAKFDLFKFAWIGSMSIEGSVFTLRADLPYNTVADILKVKSPLMIGGSGPSSIGGQFSNLLKVYCGLNLKIIFYPSSPEVQLAMERKEIDGRSGTYSSLKPTIDRGFERMFIRGRVAEKGTELLPVNEDLAADNKGKAVLRMFSAADLVGRPFVCPPGTPPERMKILSEGFAKLAKDPEMIAESRKSSMEIQFTPGKDVLNVIRAFFNQPQDVIAEFSKNVKF
jgi:tripartite-type tricarboxylate transporter receptor subunit TctC